MTSAYTGNAWNLNFNSSMRPVSIERLVTATQVLYLRLISGRNGTKRKTYKGTSPTAKMMH